MEDDLRKLIIRMTEMMQDYHIQAHSLQLTIQALKDMPQQERAEFSSVNISQMQQQIAQRVFPLIAAKYQRLFQALQSEAPYQPALRLFLGLAEKDE